MDAFHHLLIFNNNSVDVIDPFWMYIWLFDFENSIRCSDTFVFRNDLQPLDCDPIIIPRFPFVIKSLI